MLNGLSFAVLLEEGTNPTEYQYIRLRLREAGAQVTVIGLDRLDYGLEDHSFGHADVTADQIVSISLQSALQKLNVFWVSTRTGQASIIRNKFSE